jgi:tRNA pseudouridine32 synthase / 23S rRNA pseudouridine746 synthase
MAPEGIECRVLYRDALMIVIDKPAGMAVHRGPKGGASLEDGFDALRFGLPRAPALAHRLDRDTSGCLVLGRHRKALAHLGALFKHGRVGKTYWAVVEGEPDADEGEIDLPLGRLDPTRGWWMKPDAKGLPALTKWRVLGRSTDSVTSPLEGEVAAAGGGRGVDSSAGANTPLPIPPPQGGREQQAAMHQNPDKALAWLALEPVTGRTHQLRVHCAAKGWPIVGDAIYGSAPRHGGPPLHLHAAEVVVPLYPRREPVRVTAPVPEHMHALLMKCGWKDAAR